MRYVKIEQCKQGSIIAKDLFDQNLRLLIAKGKILSDNYINKIRNIGISGIYIEDKESEGININSIIPDQLKNDIIKNLQDINLDKIHDNAIGLVDCIASSDSFCNEFINMKTYDNYTYEHSLSVAVYATMLGLFLDFHMEELVNLAMAGLLHDIGKLLINKDILNKNGKLSDAEYDEIKKHTTLGYNQIKGYKTISATVKTGIYQHHENEDGTGYPLGLENDKIYKFAKIIHIVDVYDAIISKRPYKEAKTSSYALKYLIENKGTMFNTEYVDAFVKIIPAYPQGTTVKLNDGRYAIIAQNTYGNSFMPIIKIINGELIDLNDKENWGIMIVEQELL